MTLQLYANHLHDVDSYNHADDATLRVIQVMKPMQIMKSMQTTNATDASHSHDSNNANHEPDACK